jgi:ADP-ribose pyrophosphatase
MKATRSTGRKKILGAGKWLRLVNDGGWEYVERVAASGVVSIVAVTDAGELVLTEQFRRSVGGQVIDLPAGLVGDEKGTRDESCLAAAKRELLEETGFAARRFQVLAESPTSPGLTSEAVVFVRASGLRKVAAGGGIDKEKILVHCVKLEAAAGWLRRRAKAGAQVDVKTYAGLYFAGAVLAGRTTK